MTVRGWGGVALFGFGRGWEACGGGGGRGMQWARVRTRWLWAQGTGQPGPARRSVPAQPRAPGLSSPRAPPQTTPSAAPSTPARPQTRRPARPQVYETDAGGLRGVVAACRRGRGLRCAACRARGATVGCRVDEARANGGRHLLGGVGQGGEGGAGVGGGRRCRRGQTIAWPARPCRPALPSPLSASPHSVRQVVPPPLRGSGGGGLLSVRLLRGVSRPRAVV